MYCLQELEALVDGIAEARCRGLQTPPPCSTPLSEAISVASLHLEIPEVGAEPELKEDLLATEVRANALPAEKPCVDAAVGTLQEAKDQLNAFLSAGSFFEDEHFCNLANKIVELREGLRITYNKAQKSRAANASLRDEAISARLARLQRDWYKSHLEAAIASYDSIDLSLDPEDLLPADSIPNLSKNATRREILEARCKSEATARLRAWGQATQKDGDKRKLINSLLSSIAKADDFERAFAQISKSVEEFAKKYDLSALIDNAKSNDDCEAAPEDGKDNDLEEENIVPMDIVDEPTDLAAESDAPV